jgi:hypothetical protein
VYEHEVRLATEETVTKLLDVQHREPLLVPHDCTDGFLGAYWRRPEAFLDPAVRLSNSGMALLDPDVVEQRMNRLEGDLASGAWYRRHRELLDKTELDLGYRLLVAETA